MIERRKKVRYPVVCKIGGLYLSWGSDDRPTLLEFLSDRVVFMPTRRDFNKFITRYRFSLGLPPRAQLDVEFVSVSFASGELRVLEDNE